MVFVNILFSINQATRSKITPFLRLNHTHSLANDDFFSVHKNLNEMNVILK